MIKNEDVIIKLPKARNTFTGRCSVPLDQFETLKDGVNILTIKLVFTDKVVREVKLEQWMIDTAIPCNGFMLMYYSKNVYLKRKLTDKHFESKFKYMSDEVFYKKFKQEESVKRTVVSDPEVISIVRESRLSGTLWQHIPEVVASKGFINSVGKPFQPQSLANEYLKVFPEEKVNKPKHTKTYKTTGYSLPEELIIAAISLRNSGAGWKEIENIFKNEGHIAPHGQPWHNAAICAGVLQDPRGQHLRQRTLSKKKKRKKKAKSKNKSLPLQTQTINELPDAGVLSRFRVKKEPQIKSGIIETLEASGYSAEQIVAILKMKVTPKSC